jgi:hypothetical protein
VKLQRRQPMDPKLVEVTQLFARFKAAYVRSDLDVCSNLLSELKVRPSLLRLPVGGFQISIFFRFCLLIEFASVISLEQS